MSLINELRSWRNEQARIEGVEQYRVLPNAVLDALTGTLPKNKEEMLAIKGIKEAKFSKYGPALLGIIKKYTKDEETFSVSVSEKEMMMEAGGIPENLESVDQTLSVSGFLDGLNVELSGMAARVRGEVSSVDIRERVVYFTLKDSTDESTLNCLIFRFQYDISGVALAIGDEVIVEGAPDIYKPSGRLSLKVGMIELCGEGALKKAYDALKLKFETEGMFAPEKKRLLPRFPERIALITSEQGAAIGDFTMNLGAQGLKVDFYPTSVEGKKAVFEIIEALRYFDRLADKYDILVVVRGGGSLESLQAFNNEALVRELSASKIPTLLGVGHEKDVTLAALAADVMVSTPTATARTLREPWDEARGLIRHFEQHLPMLMERELSLVRTVLSASSEELSGRLREFLEYANTLKQVLAQWLLSVQSVIREKIALVDQAEKNMMQRFLSGLESAKKELFYAEDLLRQYDPTRVLKLGYSLVKSGKRIVKSAEGLEVGDILDIQLHKGSIGARIETIIPE